VRTCAACRRKAQVNDLLGVVLQPQVKAPPLVHLVRVAGLLAPVQPDAGLAPELGAGDHGAANQSATAPSELTRRPAGKLRYVCPEQNCLQRLAGGRRKGSGSGCDSPKGTVALPHAPRFAQGRSVSGSGKLVLEQAVGWLDLWLTKRAHGLSRRKMPTTDPLLLHWQGQKERWQLSLQTWT
jgi:hypothetical protein